MTEQHSNAEPDIAEVARAAAGLADEAVRPLAFDPLADEGADTRTAERGNLDLLLDVRIPVSVEVGSAHLPLDEILGLVPGSIVTLDKRVEEPIDLRVNGKLVARGEVVMVDDTYGLRITHIIDAERRLDTLR